MRGCIDNFKLYLYLLFFFKFLVALCYHMLSFHSGVMLIIVPVHFGLAL